MSKEKRGSAGGRATAIIEKENARKRVDEYNKSPNKCKWCGGDIIAPYGKPLNETKIKKFCSMSCASKFNNKNRIVNKTDTFFADAIINSCSDDEIINAFYSSESIGDFSKKNRI